MQFKRLNFFLVLFFLVPCLSVVKAADTSWHFTHNDSLRGSLNPARSCYDVNFYNLHVIIDPFKHTITGTSTISFTATRTTDSIQVDLFKNYKVLGVMFDRIWMEYKREGDHIFVHFFDTLKAGQKRTITVHYTGTPPEAKNAPWDGGFVWAKDSLGRPWVGVACEGLGASSWWPCKDYLGDKPDSMRISIGVPEGYFCVSNGQLKSINNLYDGYIMYNWLVTYPINTYDVTVNIGHYDRIRYTYASKAGNLDLDYFMLDYHKKIAEAYLQKQVKPMLDCFEKYFGPYPFTRDGYGLVETTYWGMEHQGAIAYGNHFHLNKHGFDFIIVHESAHEWWGNSLSVPDQAEMWLHESFATYAESLYMECTKGKDSAQAYLNEQKANIADNYPMIGPEGVNYYKRPDNDIYYKGTWMLHSLRNVIDNDSEWFGILYDFQQKYKYGIVNTDTFLKFLQMKQLSAAPPKDEAKEREKQKLPVSYAATGFRQLDIKTFLDEYLRQADLPELSFKVTQKGRKVLVSYYWKSAVKGFNMPVDLRIAGSRYRIYPMATAQTIKLRAKDVPGLQARSINATDVNVMMDHFLINLDLN